MVVLRYVAQDILSSMLADQVGTERYLELLNEDTTPRILKSMKE